MFKDTELPNIVELRNVSQSYDGGQSYVIQNTQMLIEDKPDKGQFIVILGASGCGKSTILRYIAGLQKPTEGDVLIHDKPITSQNRVSMVFQQYSSLPWMTVLDNVALGLRYKGIDEKERNQRAMELIEMVGLAGHEKKFAQYPTLSGGQLQRVAIARSMIANPEILLMDEPFGALDINTRLQMQELLLDLWYKFHPTVVFVTHDISEAVYLADDIYMMKKAPSRFVEHVVVDLPYERDREIKRQTHFMELVRDVEDRMLGIVTGD
ncbi:MAG: ABC transporter ATP-binding protein [Saprospirales bacterium]|nr:ABC transporter ATP-binding protein [Saprospirales bacterium]MBK8492452.1 ABC transporter ATP-binding protein [Saprospirales bacterium]